MLPTPICQLVAPPDRVIQLPSVLGLPTPAAPPLRNKLEVATPPMKSGPPPPDRVVIVGVTR